METFGEYFYDHVVEFGYVNLLKVLGKNPEDFLMNLDTMHLALARMSVEYVIMQLHAEYCLSPINPGVYPPLMPPLYTCVKLPNGDLTLYYFSKRPNLESIVVGLIRKAIKELFGIAVKVTVLQKRADKGYCMRTKTRCRKLVNNPVRLFQANF